MLFASHHTTVLTHCKPDRWESQADPILYRAQGPSLHPHIPHLWTCCIWLAYSIRSSLKAIQDLEKYGICQLKARSQHASLCRLRLIRQYHYHSWLLRTPTESSWSSPKAPPATAEVYSGSHLPSSQQPRTPASTQSHSAIHRRM